MYATHCTRPDIAYAVCKLSRYTSNPSHDHWKEIGRIFGYLKRTRQLSLYYDRFPAILEGYSDASWITGSSDNKSTTGWIFTLSGGAVCWGSKKQTCITHSTNESEFLALATAGKEAEWLRNMLLDIELWPQPMPAISLHCDSQSTLSRAYNKVYNGKSRHVSLRHAYIKELISNGIITIEYIRSCKNLADPFTKGLPKDIVFGTTREMDLKPIELALRTLGGDALNNVVSFMNEEIQQYKSVKIGGASEVKLSTEVKKLFRNSSPLGLDEFHISFQKLLESLLDFPQIRKVLCLADVDQ
ncbi:hypothetical protein Tco_0170107 [Tanacetum coccineum]